MANRKSKMSKRLNPSGAPVAQEKPVTEDEAIEISAQQEVRAIEMAAHKSKLIERRNARVDEILAEKGIKRPTDAEASEGLVASEYNALKMARMKRLAAIEAQRQFYADFPEEQGMLEPIEDTK